MIVEEGHRVLEIEAEAILSLKERIGEPFVEAVKAIRNCRGKVIMTGMGKSGQIARKISSTLSSTGTPSVYIHPAESSHGDLGVLSQEDLVFAISYGGESQEMNTILNYVGRKGLTLIVMTGKPKSTLGEAANIVLDIHVEKEACPLGLAPTASSTATLAMGDAIAMAVLKDRGFREEDFAEFHPGGSLGRRLLTRVKDLMHVGEALPLVSSDTELREVISLMTAKDVRGCAGVVNSDGNLMGIVTDGDVRRLLEKKPDPLKMKVGELMVNNPKTIDMNELAERALFIMDDFEILMLFVVDKNSPTPQKPVGLIHLHDLTRGRIR